MQQPPLTYTIHLPQFEGPFDLLLFFIERDELNIYNIPIAKITDDFLAYIREMESLNVDLASEFIVVAATLMQIKAKMLLPRKAKDEDGNEIDPREALVQRLLEYKRYKGVLDELRAIELRRHERQQRGNAVRELKSIATRALVDEELENLTLYKLLNAYRRVLERYEVQQRRFEHQVVRYPYTMASQRAYIVTHVTTLGRMHFEQLFEACENRIHAIFNFLALLELVQLQQVRLQQGEGINNFWVAPVAAQ